MSLIGTLERRGETVGVIGLEPEQYATLSASTKKDLVASVVKRIDIALVDLVSEVSLGNTLSDILNPEVGSSGRRYGIFDKGVEISLWSPDLAKVAKQINLLAKKAAKLST